MPGNSAPSEIIRQLLHKHVPALASGAIELEGIARDPGNRAMIAVHSTAPGGDPVGAVVGERGSRIKLIVQELGGEKVDVVRWDESIDQFIRNLVAPIRVQRIDYDQRSHQASLTLTADGASFFSEPEAARLELASQLTGWHLTVGPPAGS